MPLSYRNNLLKAYRFEKPEWIPIIAGFTSLIWENNDPEEIEELLVSHPILFPGYQRGAGNRNQNRLDMIAGQPYTDGWGCVWETEYSGMVGQVVHHPLANWEILDSYSPPDPAHHDGLFPLDWKEIGEYRDRARDQGSLVRFDLPHGHTYLLLQYLRGFENLMFDMADNDPRLDRLIGMIETFNLQLLKRYLGLSPDIVGIPEDLGGQTRLVISPAMWRKYIKPSYLRMTSLIKSHGVLVHEHSDGHIMEIIDDLVEAGGDIINLQDLVNGIDNIARHVKGRLAIDLDIDRQKITVLGSPQDVDNHIRECVVKLGSPQGGLSLFYQPWPPAPVVNLRAAFDAMEKYCFYYS